MRAKLLDSMRRLEKLVADHERGRVFVWMGSDGMVEWEDGIKMTPEEMEAAHPEIDFVVLAWE